MSQGVQSLFGRRTMLKTWLVQLVYVQSVEWAYVHEGVKC
jgi:hypothetical protein